MVQNRKQPFGLVLRGPFACRYMVRDDGYDWDANLRPMPPDTLWDKPTDIQASTWLDAGFYNEAVPCHVHQPLFEPDLHRQFGALEPTCEDIKRFANKHGLLGNVFVLHYPDLLARHQPQKLKLGEPLEFWKQEIENMKILLSLWDYAQDGKRVEWFKMVSLWGYQPENAQLRLHFPNGKQVFHTIAQENIPEERHIVERLRKEPSIRPVRVYLIEELHRKLQGHINPKMNFFDTGQIIMVPDSLLTALYVSFVLEVSGKSEPMVKCQGCNEYFLPEKGRKYHDKKCKNRDWWQHNRGKMSEILS